jgi:hypothetical protein
VFSLQEVTTTGIPSSQWHAQLSEGLRKLGKQQGVTMGFSFTAFPASELRHISQTIPHSMPTAC